MGREVFNHSNSSSNVEGDINCIQPSQVEERVRCKLVPHCTPSSAIEVEPNHIPISTVEKSVGCEDLTHCTSLSSTIEGELNCIPPSRGQIRMDVRLYVIPPPLYSRPGAQLHPTSSTTDRELKHIPSSGVEDSVECGILNHHTPFSFAVEGGLNCIPPSRL